MKALANLSIRDKFVGIILIATVLSVGAGFAVVVFKSIHTFQDDLITNTETIARLVETEAGVYVAFDDVVSARADLNRVVDALPWISDACFFDLDGKVFVCSDEGQPPDRVPSKIENTEPDVPGKTEDSKTEDTESDPHFSEGYVDFFLRVLYTDPGDEEEIDVGSLYLRATTELYAEKVREDIVYMTIVMLAVVAAAVALAYLLQGLISKPILYLAEMAQRISNNADYTVRVPKPGNDEIGILYDGFNDMLEQIQQRQEDLQRSNRDLDQFAYVASHDLKAPLRAIATLSGWIEEDLKDSLSEESSEQMQLLRSRVQRMDQLIEGILQYSRAGRMDSHGEMVDVRELIVELVELIAPPDSFEISIADDMPTLVTKRLRLEQVFSNLITNAIKYHHRDGGRVEITSRKLGRFYEFSVSDDGPGIAAEHHEKVFLMFQTLQPRDQLESTGLGLSLVKKLVEEEGGSIHLDSSPGHGAAFRFTWPADLGEESTEETQS